MTLKITEKNALYVRKTLWLALLVLVLLTASRVYTYAAASKNIPKRIEMAKNAGEIDKEIIDKNVKHHKDMASQLKKSPLFTPVATAHKPSLPVCTSILGDRALINGKFYTIGQEVNGAKIINIGANDVTVMWEEKETKLVPFAVSNLTEEQKRAKPQQHQSQSKGGQPPQANVVAAPAPNVRPPSSGGDRGSSRGSSRGGFGNMSSEERRQMFERYQQMSPDEQRKFREERMRQFRGR